MSKRRTQKSRSATPREARPQAAREKVRDIFVARPFEGLADEPDWIAMRELVPAATAPLQLAPELVQKYGEREVVLATVLPMAWPGLTKPDGRILIGLQRGTQSGDISRDLAVTVLNALETEPGSPVPAPPLPGPGPRLQDVLADGALEVTVYSGFEFWLDEAAPEGEVKDSLERANASVFPTEKLTAAPAAYWCRFPGRAHVRWVLPEAEDIALAALARLSARGALTLGDGTKFAGMFRAHGLLVPVWDLPVEAAASDWEEPVAQFAQRYAEARSEDGELDSAARRARQGLVGRQLTLR
ncbi:MAG TPA: DUF5926 family protein [Micromonosporaceae bacterium]